MNKLLSSQAMFPKKISLTNDCITQASELSTNTTHQTPHLLLVEDSMIALKILEHFANVAGCRTTSAISGEQAFEFVSEGKTAMPILGLTAHIKHTTDLEGKQFGMNDVFTKPIDKQWMQCILNRFLPHANNKRTTANTLNSTSTIR